MACYLEGCLDDVFGLIDVAAKEGFQFHPVWILLLRRWYISYQYVDTALLWISAIASLHDLYSLSVLILAFLKILYRTHQLFGLSICTI